MKNRRTEQDLDDLTDRAESICRSPDLQHSFRRDFVVQCLKIGTLEGPVFFDALADLLAVWEPKAEREKVK